MNRLAVFALLGGCALMCGCSPGVKVEHEVKPIHITIDVNVRVDKALEDFFDYEKEVPAAGKETI